MKQIWVASSWLAPPVGPVRTSHPPNKHGRCLLISLRTDRNPKRLGAGRGLDCCFGQKTDNWKVRRVFQAASTGSVVFLIGLSHSHDPMNCFNSVELDPHRPAADTTRSALIVLSPSAATTAPDETGILFWMQCDLLMQIGPEQKLQHPSCPVRAPVAVVANELQLHIPAQPPSPGGHLQRPFQDQKCSFLCPTSQGKGDARGQRLWQACPPLILSCVSRVMQMFPPPQLDLGSWTFSHILFGFAVCPDQLSPTLRPS